EAVAGQQVEIASYGHIGNAEELGELAHPDPTRPPNVFDNHRLALFREHLHHPCPELVAAVSRTTTTPPAGRVALPVMVRLVRRSIPLAGTATSRSVWLIRNK